jgi:hypothetical protein
MKLISISLVDIIKINTHSLHSCLAAGVTIKHAVNPIHVPPWPGMTSLAMLEQLQTR